jgi:M penetrans paralogue family 26
MDSNQQRDYLSASPSSNLQSLPNATVSLVLGILSIVICGVGVILGIIGIVMANKDIALYRNNPGVYSETSFNNSKTGRTCSIIGIIVSAVFILAYVAYMIWIFYFISTLQESIK